MFRKLKISTIILIVLCLIGLSLLLYPTAADFWNTHFATKSVSNYIEKVNNLTEDQNKKIWTEAIEYNQKRASQDFFSLPQDMREAYNSLFNIAGDGVMGYIEIPKMNIILPLYHGTSDDVLSSAIGHVEWSSLPTGGPSTHCVVSGHRGLPSAKLLTDLDILREGDVFTINVLSETLTYEVDQIRTVEPTDLTYLNIEKDKDYCTLVTCTPYGINTHRLLVRGHRIETQEYVHVISEAVIIDPLIVAPIVAFPFLFTLFMMIMLKKPPKKPTTNVPSLSSTGGNHDENS